MKRVIFLALAFAAFALAEGNLETAKKLYNAGDYDRAASIWKEELDGGLKNPEILYNLGNASYREGKLGFAILYYESALRLKPNDADIQHNLKVAKAQTRDKTEEAGEENPILAALFQVHHFLGVKTQLILLGVLIWLICIASFLRVLSRSPQVKNGCIAVVFLLSICFCAVLASAGYKVYFAETNVRGVVTASSADVLSGPNEKNQTLNVLSEGTSFDVLSVQNGFAEIALGERIKGFVSLSEIGVVNGF